jgi:hypothetical protein
VKRAASDRLSVDERSMLVALSQEIRSLRTLAALLCTTPTTLDRLAMGFRGRRERVAIIRLCLVTAHASLVGRSAA